MEPWYRVVTLRKEVREGRSFSPDEFAIALEQVVNGTAPDDYRDPRQFFSRTFFTRTLTKHTGRVLRRLTGETANTAPVVSMVTQFGGGKTHTLTALYHLAKTGKDASKLSGVAELLRAAGITDAPSARVGVFVGNAWDPRDGEETPHGSPWPASSRVTTESPHSVRRPARHHREPKQSAACSRPPMHPCCCCSTKYSIL